MRTGEFQPLFESHGPVSSAFVGAFPLDQCPLELPEESFVILNLEYADISI